MGAGWVKAWLNTWYARKLSSYHHLPLGYRSEKLEHTEADQQDPTDQDAHDESTEASVEASVEAVDDVMDILGDAHMPLLAAGVPRESWFEVVEAGIADVVT